MLVGRVTRRSQAAVTLVLRGTRLTTRFYSHAALITAGGRYAALWEAWSDARRQPTRA